MFATHCWRWATEVGRTQTIYVVRLADGVRYIYTLPFVLNELGGLYTGGIATLAQDTGSRGCG